MNRQQYKIQCTKQHRQLIARLTSAVTFAENCPADHPQKNKFIADAIATRELIAQREREFAAMPINQPEWGTK